MNKTKSLLALSALLITSMGFAVTKKVGDGPIFLTINNKTNKGYLIDEPAQMTRLLKGSTETPLGIIKPNETLTLSGLEFLKGKPKRVAGWPIYLNIVALNPDTNLPYPTPAAVINLYPRILALADENILFEAGLTIGTLNKPPKEEATLEIPEKQLSATSFVVNVTLEGDNLEKSDIDASAGTGTVKQ